MTASTQTIVAQRHDVLRVPNQALRYVPGGLAAVGTGAARATANSQPQLWVLRDRQAVAVNVVTGLADDSYTEIAKGDVQLGDEVITAEAGGQATQPGLPPPRL